MIYSDEQLKSIRKVENVFLFYIRDCNEFDLLWSEKVGYVLLDGIDKERRDFYVHPRIIVDARELCGFLLREIAFDVIKTQDHFHDLHETSEQERNCIKKIYSPYMQQLPEYSDLIEEVFVDPCERKFEEEEK